MKKPLFYNAAAIAIALLVSFVLGGPQSGAHELNAENKARFDASEAAFIESTLHMEGPRASVGVADLQGLGDPITGLVRPLAEILPTAPNSGTWDHTSSLILKDIKRLSPLPPQTLQALDGETLWLARCIFSETKRPEEQELVAWVIRNRVETQYRGKRTYRDVVLDPYQFSAFIPGTRTRAYYSRLNVHSKVPGWQRALRIAYEVKRMPDVFRPFSPETRHFYSEQSMKGQRHPAWAIGHVPVAPKRSFELEEKRFRFYKSVT